MTIRWQASGGVIYTPPVEELTFQDDDGKSFTVPKGGSAVVVHRGKHMRIRFTERGVVAEELSDDDLRHFRKEQQLKETAAAVAKVMGW